MLEFLGHMKKMYTTALLAAIFSQKREKKLLEQFSMHRQYYVSKIISRALYPGKSSQKFKNDQDK